MVFRDRFALVSVQFCRAVDELLAMDLFCVECLFISTDVIHHYVSDPSLDAHNFSYPAIQLIQEKLFAEGFNCGSPVL